MGDQSKWRKVRDLKFSYSASTLYRVKEGTKQEGEKNNGWMKKSLEKSGLGARIVLPLLLKKWERQPNRKTAARSKPWRLPEKNMCLGHTRTQNGDKMLGGEGIPKEKETPSMQSSPLFPFEPCPPPSSSLHSFSDDTEHTHIHRTYNLHLQSPIPYLSTTPLTNPSPYPTPTQFPHPPLKHASPPPFQILLKPPLTPLPIPHSQPSPPSSSILTLLPPSPPSPHITPPLNQNTNTKTKPTPVITTTPSSTAQAPYRSRPHTRGRPG